MYRKRYPFRFRKNIWKTVRKVQKEVKKMKKTQEIKWIDPSSNMRTNETGNMLQPVFNLDRGPNEDNRIGDSVTILSLYFRFVIYFPNYATTLDKVRVIIGLQKKTCDVPQTFQSTYKTSGTDVWDNMNAMRHPTEEGKNFTLLFDRIITNKGDGNRYTSFKFYKKWKTGYKMGWEQTTLMENALTFYFLNCGAGVTAPYLYWDGKVRYVDS